MRKRIMSTFVLLFIIMMAVGVKANSIWDAELILEKSEDSGELYNLMPTEVKKGDVISVKLILKDIKGWRVEHGNNLISWDKEAFELIETDGKYYRCLSNNIDSYWTNIEKNGSIYLSYSFKNKVLNSNDEDIFELKFRVKNDVKDGVYEINSSWDGEFVIRLDDRSETRNASGNVLKYQVGKTRLVSDYTKDNINPHSYIIGKYLFAQKSDAYDGQLTTEHIMLASKSIASDNKDDMIIYLKNARGQWKNAITNEPITPPSEFKIEYVDMKANYTENGVYSNTGDKNIVRLIQINENEAIVTIETYDVRVHGIANINNKIATLSINGKNYKITISDNELNLESNDSYIGKMKLYKKANYSVNDYYNDNYIAGGFGGPGPYPLFYLNSQHSGKYVYGNYELYLVRIGDTEAKFLLKEKGKTNFIFNEYLSGNEGGWFFDGEETTYFFNTDEKEYGINWENNQINVKCKGVCTNSYAGTYTKESTLSMEDVFHVWERNRVSYGVIFDEDNGSENYPTYIEFNKSINSDYGYWEPYKEGSVFVGWYLNNSVFDLDTPITKPITLEARYEASIPATPTLSYAGGFTDYENGVYKVELSISSPEYYDGFEIYNADGSHEPVDGLIYMNSLKKIDVPENQKQRFYARTYRIYNGEKRYSESSNIVEVYCQNYIVTFDSNGGSNVESIKVPGFYQQYINKPANPTKEGYTFVEWQLNGETFDFSTPITGDVTLVAKWEINSYTVTFDSQGGSNVANQAVNVGEKVIKPANPTKEGYIFLEWDDFDGAYDFNKPVTDDVYLHAVWTVPTPVLTVQQSDRGPYIYKLSFSNIDDYCVGTCKMDGSDEYSFTGFNIYKKVGNNYEQVGSFSSNYLASENGNYYLQSYEVDVVDIYVVKVDIDTEKYEYSNEVVIDKTLQVDTSITVPKIKFDAENRVNYEENRFRKTVEHKYDNVFYVSISNDLSLYRNNMCQDNENSEECYLVDGYDFFIKQENGSRYWENSSTASQEFVDEFLSGDKLTIVARAYKLDSNNRRIYSPESNEITIDLTNPTYTFETLDLESDSSKVIVRAYINDYEVYFSQVNIEGNTTNYTDEGGSLEFTMSKSAIENVNTITLKLSDTKSVTATRKN